MKPMKEEEMDAAFSEALHRRSVTAKGGIMAMLNKDHVAHKTAVDEYLGYWEINTARDGSQDSREVLEYYDLATDPFEYIFGKSIHFCQILPGVPLSSASVRHEHYLAHRLDLRKDQKVLDVGCGVGGPAREIAQSFGVNIVGLNYNDYQIKRATLYTAADGLSGQVTFVHGDFMQIPMEPESFDAAYSIEATSYAPDLERVYGQVFRSLKPGGKFAVYELILTDAYDDESFEHRKMRSGIEQGLGMTNIAKISESINGMKAAGFEMVEAADLACSPDTLPWYYLISGSLRSINSIWDIVKILKWKFLRSAIAASLAGMLEAMGILPPGSRKIAEAMKEAIDLVVLAGQRGLFTPIFFLVGRKPL